MSKLPKRRFCRAATSTPHGTARTWARRLLAARRQHRTKTWWTNLGRRSASTIKILNRCTLKINCASAIESAGSSIHARGTTKRQRSFAVGPFVKQPEAFRPEGVRPYGSVVLLNRQSAGILPAACARRDRADRRRLHRGQRREVGAEPPANRGT